MWRKLPLNRSPKRLEPRKPKALLSIIARNRTLMERLATAQVWHDVDVRHV